MKRHVVIRQHPNSAGKRHPMEHSPTQWLLGELRQVDYPAAHRLQLQWVEAIHAGRAGNLVLLLEHTPVLTIGKRGGREHVRLSEAELRRRGIAIIKVERGGNITWHGPGQLVGYLIIDLRSQTMDIRRFVRTIEEIMIRTAADYGVIAERNELNPGVWVAGRKMGSIGLAVRRGISFHGFALNVCNRLEPFEWIDPCGLKGVAMTTLSKEACAALDLRSVKSRISAHMSDLFGVGFRRVDPRMLDTLPKKEAKKPPFGPAHSPRLGAKPVWLRKQLPDVSCRGRVDECVEQLGLHTVCREAGCPNRWECRSRGTATFMILGDRCTRDCRFCGVKHGQPAPPALSEPEHVAEAALRMGIRHVVVTSVTRDDLQDGGAGIFAATIRSIREKIPAATVEVLVPDFQGSIAALQTVLSARPDVLNHNIETVWRLYPIARAGADYRRSLTILARAARADNPPVTKSGLMLGLGESDSEIISVLSDLREAGCRILTLGQYLQPTRRHLPVKRYIPPESFVNWRCRALETGFSEVAAGPFVRSSFRAGELYRNSFKSGSTTSIRMT